MCQTFYFFWRYGQNQSNRPSQRVSLTGWILILLIIMPAANCQCFNLTKNTTQNGCIICISGGNIDGCIVYLNSSFSLNINSSACNSECCPLSYGSSLTFCNTDNSSSSQSEQSSQNNNKELAIILIICFFSVPAAICLCIIIARCLRIYRQRTNPGMSIQHPISAINLQNINIYQAGPLYIDQSQSCSICLEQNCNLRTKCGHIYHPQCLFHWILKKQTCPLCVSQQFNPVLIHCSKCLRSGKLDVIMKNMDAEVVEGWKNNECLICEVCLDQKEGQGQISIDLTIMKPNQYQHDENQIINGMVISSETKLYLTESK